MSGSDRGGINQAALGIWLWVALLFASAIFVWALTEQSQYSKTTTDHAEQYRRDADNHIRQTCLTRTGQAKTDCIAIAVEAAREGQRKEYDLYSQRAVALWTLVMGYAAVFGVSLSGIGVYLIWTTFQSSQRAVEVASDTLRAMKRFEAAVMVVSFVDPLTYSTDVDGKIVATFQLKCKNHGRSPAVVDSIKLTGHETYYYVVPLEVGKSVSCNEIYDVIIPETRAIRGYVEYDTTIDRGIRAIFNIMFSDDISNISQIHATVHPYGIVERHEEGYDLLENI